MFGKSIFIYQDGIKYVQNYMNYPGFFIFKEKKETLFLFDQKKYKRCIVYVNICTYKINFRFFYVISVTTRNFDMFCLLKN